MLSVGFDDIVYSMQLCLGNQVINFFLPSDIMKMALIEMRLQASNCFFEC